MLELDALALEEEEEGPSYLADLNKVPDFVDEAPIEMGEVSSTPFASMLEYSAECSVDASKTRSCQDNRVGLKGVNRLIVTSGHPGYKIYFYEAA
jgi:hypothetical protein